LQVGRRIVLAGMGNDGMRLLGEITDPEEVSELVAKAGGAGGGSVFASLLTHESANYAAPEPMAVPGRSASEAAVAAPPGLKALLSRLRSLKMHG
ncbi:MAG: hypothetical protein D6788_10270, partial [Planctomycetota bacterium]